MQPLEIDSAVFCDGARYTIISRENSSILTCPVASGAGGYTLNRVEGRDIDLELDRLTGHAACIAVDVPTWCRIAGDPLDAVADALADLLCETPTRFELERLAAASPVLTANTPGIPVFPAGIAPAANSYTLAGCCRSALVRGLSSPELYRTALTAAGATISRRRPAAPRGPRDRPRRERPSGAGRRSSGGASRSGTCVHTAGPRPYHQGNIRIAGAFCAPDRLRSFAMEHIVLEYDESTRTALVVATSGGREPVLSGHASPYIVADGYDFESRSWGAGHYFTDIAEAKIDYERSCRHPYPLAEGKLRDDEFCTIRWCREDIAEALSEYLAYPIPATEKNIDAAIGQLMAHDSFQDRSIEDGWETIGGIIVEDELDLGFSTKQGADFYRDAFGLSNFTEAVVWPSSEGDAAFVMTSAVDSEDGDLAVYKIDADLIGDSKITVDDIERLGGKRELCVYKHGFDGIEVIRAFANRVAVDRFDERFGVNNLYGELPDLAPTLRKVTEDARTAVQQPRDPQAIAAAALSAAEGGAKGAVEHVGNKR